MIENEKNISNKIAIVTGGARGIGKAIVTKLALNGYTVILDYNKSEKEAKIIEKEFKNIYTIKADVSNYEEVKKLVEFTINKFKKIDLLVNNAGIDLVSTINDTSIEDLTQMIERYKEYDCWLESPFVSEEIFTNLEDFLIDFELLNDYVPYKDLVNNFYNE